MLGGPMSDGKRNRYDIAGLNDTVADRNPDISKDTLQPRTQPPIPEPSYRSWLNNDGSLSMTQPLYLKLFEEESMTEIKLTFEKNSDYAGLNDAFKNFRGIQFLTDGRISVEDGIVVRLTDKFQRVINLLTKDPHVKSESIVDTLRDLSVYAKILRIYIMSKKINAEMIAGNNRAYDNADKAQR